MITLGSTDGQDPFIHLVQKAKTWKRICQNGWLHDRDMGSHLNTQQSNTCYNAAKKKTYEFFIDWPTLFKKEKKPSVPM